MSLLASLFPTHLSTFNIGISYEGRDIPAMRVGVRPAGPPEGKRKTILITGGAHAREWISVSTVNYIAYYLITSYGKDREITHLLEQFDFVFIPTLNVDGYAYTWDSDRLWRKNRQETNLRFCRGVDLDRGWGYEWDGASTRGNPCSESYAGEYAFQAVESQRFSEWAKNETENNNVDFVGYLDFHSYSQQILYPYSYSCDRSPPSLENLQELGSGLAKAIRLSSGEHYGINSACEGSATSMKDKGGKKTIHPRMETGGGSALDWFYHELKVRFAYQIKLRDTGSYGFLLPKEHIIPTGEEAVEAIKYFGHFVLGGSSMADSPSSGTSPLASTPDESEGDKTPPAKAEETTALVETVLHTDDSEGFNEPMIAGKVGEMTWELKRRR
jgi:extracellular matrix protein 14